jgi:hypothetical protein
MTTMTMARSLTLSAFLLAVLTAPGYAQNEALPDPAMTPGAVNPAVTQQTIATTICVQGWTRQIRPPMSFTEPLKRQQIEAYGYRDRRLGHYEEDHLIPLELGGAASDPRNLWPEPHYAEGGWGSYAKDRLEFKLNELVCDGTLPLDAAQRAIATDWVAAYRRYLGPVPDNRPLHYYRREDRY